jgi:inner membrane protein involved in colicin E2 resistance
MTYARSGLLAKVKWTLLASQQLTLIRLALKLFLKLLARVEYLTRHLDYCKNSTDKK